MTQPKHTQGPWGLSNNATENLAPTEWIIGTMTGRNIVAEGITNAQDARLIAAAPMLLELVQSMRAALVEQCGFETDCELIADADAAITRATTAHV